MTFGWMSSRLSDPEDYTCDFANENPLNLIALVLDGVPTVVGLAGNTPSVGRDPFCFYRFAFFVLLLTTAQFRI